MTLLSRQEMVAVVDRYTKTDAGGYTYTSVVKIRDELTYQWAFNELQVRQTIFDMRNAGLLNDVC
jgi:Mg/Co/Ni transporter MgtE